jgi:hypothetical protein
VGHPTYQGECSAFLISHRSMSGTGKIKISLGGAQSSEMISKRIRTLMTKEGNRTCFDCGANVRGWPCGFSGSSLTMDRRILYMWR